MQTLASAIYEAISKAEPKVIKSGGWHLPYITEEERDQYVSTTLLQMSAARCARVSYHKHDGTNPSTEDDLQLFNKLLISKPLHASPAEHQATPYSVWGPKQQERNFRGWGQFRAYLEEDWPY